MWMLDITLEIKRFNVDSGIFSVIMAMGIHARAGAVRAIVIVNCATVSRTITWS